MHEAAFELIEIPHVRQSGKNSADIRMVVDALDLCYTKAHVDTFVILSGDSDFSPLVSKLRENNKVVIGVGVKKSTSDCSPRTATNSFSTTTWCASRNRRKSVRRSTRPHAPQAAPDKTAEEEGARQAPGGLDMIIETSKR